MFASKHATIEVLNSKQWVKTDTNDIFCRTEARLNLIVIYLIAITKDIASPIVTTGWTGDAGTARAHDMVNVTVILSV